MTRLLKDHYFWYVFALIVFLGILTYVAEAAILDWLSTTGEWDLVSMAFQRVLFLVAVAIAAWRFGVGGGLAACFAIGLVVLPRIVDEAVNQWRPDFLVELWIVAAIGIALSWLIGTRKRAEEELREHYKREKNLRRELEEQMRQRVEFTRALVHELKTPLTPVLGASAILVTKLKEEPWLSLAKNINRGAKNLNRRVDELLDLTRGEIGMLRLQCKWVDPLQLLNEIVDYVMPEALMKEQTLTADLPPSIPKAWLDDDRLRQVILNFLANAFKFTPKGGKIILKARRRGGNMIVAVQDTGRGINRAEQKHLFLPYYRVESDTEHFGGLGLGLALSKMLIELHGGKVWVKSQKGKGSTFSFSVPLKAAADGK